MNDGDISCLDRINQLSLPLKNDKHPVKSLAGVLFMTLPCSGTFPDRKRPKNCLNYLLSLIILYDLLII